MSKLITNQTIFQIMANVNGASFISIDTLTEVKLTGGKKNPLQGRVTKETVGNSVMVFQNKHTNAYENMVRRRLEKEGKNPDNFKLGERAWGTRIPGTPVVMHGDKLYLEVIFLKPGKSVDLVDGVPTPRENIEGYPVTKTDESAQGGLSDQVIIRTFKLESITEIRIDGQRFKPFC